MNANESFEIAAAAFQEAAGYLAPGKNGCPREPNGDLPHEVARDWKIWCSAVDYMKKVSLEPGLEASLKESKKEILKIAHANDKECEAWARSLIEHDALKKEVEAVLQHLPKEFLVRCCEGGGLESLAGSLAISVLGLKTGWEEAEVKIAALTPDKKAVIEVFGDLKSKLAVAVAAIERLFEGDDSCMRACLHEVYACPEKESLEKVISDLGPEAKTWRAEIKAEGRISAFRYMEKFTDKEIARRDNPKITSGLAIAWRESFRMAANESDELAEAQRAKAKSE